MPEAGTTTRESGTQFPTHRLTVTTLLQQNRFEGILFEQLSILSEKKTLRLTDHLPHHCLFQVVHSAAPLSTLRFHTMRNPTTEQWNLQFAREFIHLLLSVQYQLLVKVRQREVE